MRTLNYLIVVNLCLYFSQNDFSLHVCCSHVKLEGLHFQVKDSICKEWKIQGKGEAFKEQHGISSGSVLLYFVCAKNLVHRYSIFSCT